MASLKDISVVVEGAVTESRAIRSGEKYVTPQGFTAIKDGQKQRAGTVPAPATGRKPSWIRAQLPVGAGFGAVKGIVHEHRLATVSQADRFRRYRQMENPGAMQCRQGVQQGIEKRIDLDLGRRPAKLSRPSRRCRALDRLRNRIDGVALLGRRTN